MIVWQLRYLLYYLLFRSHGKHKHNYFLDIS